MPVLHWAGKHLPEPTPASLGIDSLVYPQGTGYPEAIPQDRLIFGENLAVMAALLAEYEGRIHLIYADPPFFTNRRYQARVGHGEDSRRPQEWQLAEGYSDSWPNIEAYLDMLYPRLALMHRLLAPDGAFYLHLDWHANAYARLLLDEIFGPERLLNEIVWVYHGPSPIRSAFNRKHDTLLVYTKSQDYTFNTDAVRQPYDPTTIKTFASSPKAGFGKVPDLARGKVPEDWWYFPVVARLHSERTGYPTQKPEALLKRIVLASSNPGDLVADFFCGSGTTALVARQTGRLFIAADGAWRAIHATYTRLVERGEKPFRLEFDQRHGNLERPPAPIAPSRLGDHIVLPPSLLEGLAYWEIDPSWDGQIFHSAAQALRPYQKGEIPPQMKITATPQPGSPVAVRMVDAQGARFQNILK